MEIPIMYRAIWLISLVVLFCNLYASVELTRLIIKGIDGIHLYAPSHWVAELIAIWAGYLMVTGLIVWLILRLNKANKRRQL